MEIIANPLLFPSEMIHNFWISLLKLTSTYWRVRIISMYSKLTYNLEITHTQLISMTPQKMVPEMISLLAMAILVFHVKFPRSTTK